MPGVNFYLDQKALDVIRAKSKASHKPISRIIREAVELYVMHDERNAAKERILSSLTGSKPLGGLKKWDDFHKERTDTDADRS